MGVNDECKLTREQWIAQRAAEDTRRKERVRLILDALRDVRRRLAAGAAVPRWVQSALRVRGASEELIEMVGAQWQPPADLLARLDDFTAEAAQAEAGMGRGPEPVDLSPLLIVAWASVVVAVPESTAADRLAILLLSLYAEHGS